MFVIHTTHVGYTPNMVPQALKKEIEHVEEKPLRFLVKKEKPVPRPATPTVHEPPEVSSCLIQDNNVDSLFIAETFVMLSPSLFRVRKRKNVQSSSSRSY